MNQEIILASSSPRRKELLQQAGIPFQVIPSDAEELKGSGLNPAYVAEENAFRKAHLIFLRYPDRIVLGADTIVVIDGQILGKPQNREDAERMMKLLSGRTHQVITGIAVLDRNHTIRETVTSIVRFRELTEASIARYLDTGEYADKAGGYGIQGKGCTLVESIDGDYFNIVGLPICKVNKILESIWDEMSIDKNL